MRLSFSLSLFLRTCVVFIQFPLDKYNANKATIEIFWKNEFQFISFGLDSFRIIIQYTSKYVYYFSSFPKKTPKIIFFNKIL